MTIKHKLLTISIAAVTAVGLSACNTVRGVGQDISSGGHAIATVATDVQAKPKRKVTHVKRRPVKNGKSTATTTTTTKKTVKTTKPTSKTDKPKTTKTEKSETTKTDKSETTE